MTSNEEDIWEKIISVICLSISMASLYGGVIVLGWQILSYLGHGFWSPVSIITGLKSMELQWAIAPDSWFGLHNILRNIPLSLTLGGLGVLVLLGGLAFSLRNE